MKRSEMLDKLVFSIELHAGNDPGWLDHDAKLKERAYEHAHRVLQDLEEAGMLPPKKPDGCYFEMISEDYEWEPEDET